MATQALVNRPFQFTPPALVDRPAPTLRATIDEAFRGRSLGEVDLSAPFVDEARVISGSFRS